MRVRIVEDCREPATHTGALGTLVGRTRIKRLGGLTFPKIRLDDGSVIYGGECWWEELRDDLPPLSEAQAALKAHKTHVRATIEAYNMLDEVATCVKMEMRE